MTKTFFKIRGTKPKYHRNYNVDNIYTVPHRFGTKWDRLGQIEQKERTVPVGVSLKGTDAIASGESRRAGRRNSRPCKGRIELLNDWFVPYRDTRLGCIFSSGFTRRYYRRPFQGQ